MNSPIAMLKSRSVHNSRILRASSIVPPLVFLSVVPLKLVAKSKASIALSRPKVVKAHGHP